MATTLRYLTYLVAALGILAGAAFSPPPHAPLSSAIAGPLPVEVPAQPARGVRDFQRIDLAAYVRVRQQAEELLHAIQRERLPPAPLDVLPAEEPQDLVIRFNIPPEAIVESFEARSKAWSERMQALIGPDRPEPSDAALKSLFDDGQKLIADGEQIVRHWGPDKLKLKAAMSGLLDELRENSALVDPRVKNLLRAAGKLKDEVTRATAATKPPHAKLQEYRSRLTLLRNQASALRRENKFVDRFFQGEDGLDAALKELETAKLREDNFLPPGTP